MRAPARYVIVLAIMTAAACAPKAAVVPVVTVPKFPEFLSPTVPPELAASPAAINHERAWQFLQAGDLRNAEREVDAALKATPAFYPAEAAGGYVELARKDNRAAVTRFDRALARDIRYVPALVGKGQALTALDRDADALDAFRAALAINPGLLDVQRRVDVLQFRTVQQDVAAARQAARAGKTDDAVRAYRAAIASSPESAFLYRELAVIERDRGNADGALEEYRQATTLDPTDVASFVDMAALLESRNDLQGALQAYDAALALSPDPTVSARREALRRRAEIAALPPEYQAIAAAPQITRGDLAALVGVRLAALLERTQPRDVGVITDIRGHWAERWILSVTRGGIMDVFANHTFQPRAQVRRVEFAQVITRLLSDVATVAPSMAARWQNVRRRFPDITASHVAYPAASAATASGVMLTDPDGSFQPTRPVSGAEANEALERLAAMVPAPRP